jgi:large subunit ribosomal protein L1
MKKVSHAPSKRYQAVTKEVNKDNLYSIEEAIELAKKTSTTKFDSGIEAHIRLSINPKKGDQQVRSTVSLPHGNGRTVRVAVIASNADHQAAAKTAGADLVGDQSLIADIKDGKIAFDVLVATPDAMKLLAPVAKILGPKGIMPNPKDGTVTTNVADTVASLKKGKVSYKNDDSANIHILIGKASFETKSLVENYKSIIDSIMKAKPATVKGSYVKAISIASSMGPGIRVTIN